MLSVGLMKGNSIKSNEIRFDVFGYTAINGSVTSSVSQTITVYFRDGSSQNYTGSGVISFYKEDAMTNGTVRIVFGRPDRITAFQLIFLSNAFPDISILTNITELNFNGMNNISFDSPYFMALQSRLLRLSFLGAPKISSASVRNFLSNLKITYLYFGNLNGLHNRLDYTFLPNLAGTLRNLFLREFWGSLVPDCTSLVNLTSLDCVAFARVADGGLNANSVDLLPNTNTLKGVNFNNCNMTNTNVNLFIDKIYAWANTNANNSVNLNIGGNNAAPTGTYDGTTDWIGGVPTSPKAKLWHLVNSRSWIITFTA